LSVHEGRKEVRDAFLEDDDVFKVTFGITGDIAAFIPVISIFVLLKANSMEARLGAIAGLNVLLFGCLAFFTEAKHKDVFAIIAA
jgi:glycopeptide antibiotics resistance protein